MDGEANVAVEPKVRQRSRLTRPYSRSRATLRLRPRATAGRWVSADTAILALLLVGALAVRLQWIADSMPYVGHIDEEQIAAPALRMLQTGDFNPHTFEYGTLPTYLTALGFTVGYLHACANLKLRSTAAIGSIGYPYYTHTIVVYPARHLFAILSVVTLLCLGILARDVSGKRSALWLAPALASLSTGYLYLSHKYINVDIAGAFFSTAALTYLYRRWREPSLTRAIGTGALCGLTIACKYSLLWILAPGLLAVLLTERGERLLHCAALLAGAVGAFLVTVPYALGDFAAFINEVGGAAFHYAVGHGGFSAEPGLAQLGYYLRQFDKEFGLGWSAFTAIGAFALLRSDWRRGVVLLSFPLAHVAYMSLQRVHFNRHMAGVFVLLPVFIAVGLMESRRWIAVLMLRSAWWRERIHLIPPVATSIAAILFLAGVSWRNVITAYHPTTDSRKLARRWIENHLPEGATLVIPDKLRMDTRALRVDTTWSKSRSAASTARSGERRARASS